MNKRIGVVGLGDMGSGLAKNLIKNGFETSGFDLSEARMKAFADMGGDLATSAGTAGSGAFAVFVMVMNGKQAKSIIFGKGGLDSDDTTWKRSLSFGSDLHIHPAGTCQAGCRSVARLPRRSVPRHCAADA